MKWEYKVFTYAFTGGSGRQDFNQQLASLGDDGWELVSAHWHNELKVTLIFKRPRQ